MRLISTFDSKIINMKNLQEAARQLETWTASNLSELVRIPSLSGDEAKVQEAIMKQMKEAGFDEVRMDGLGNVIGRIGSGPRVMAFDGHVDTVDVGNRQNWSFDPYSGEIRDGFVHGRGSVDQKGGVASMITAGKLIRQMGVPEDKTILFVGSVMEEDCDGLCWKYLVEEENLKPEVVVSTEPTNLNIYRGHRGRMEIHVEFRGLSSHGSAPERGKNAIYMASKVALEIEKLNERLATDPFLGKGSVTISEMVTGSPSLCAVADYARLHLDRRLTWGETKESALAEIENLVTGMDAKVSVLEYKGKAFTGLEYGMEKYYPTWKLETDHPAVEKSIEAYHSAFGSRPETGKWTFSTNGVTINGIYGIPVIGFGPGNEVMAHAPDEKIPVDHLNRAAIFYTSFVYTF